MRAVRVHRFGGIEELVLEDVPRPAPGAGQVLVRVKVCGVGPWDAWVRSGKSVIAQPLPLTPGSDLSGVVEEVGPGVEAFRPGDAVFGVTNARFTGAYAEYAVAEAAMLARKPSGIGDAEAASVPVVATTAWQMMVDYGGLAAGRRVLVHGAAGNVGAFAVQIAKRAGAEVIATARAGDLDVARRLGADRVLDGEAQRFEETVRDVDVVLDTVGGDTLDRSFEVLKPGGTLVSSAAAPDQERAAQRGVRAVFFLVEITTARLDRIGELLASGGIAASVGEVLPLSDARLAHEMLAGKPHRRGKIVLMV
jgi:NADPH:quinone reductase-like Zn-dependent oxidoreductase